jgi:hypothetical protein
MQRACTVLSSKPCQGQQYFYTSHKLRDFRKEKLLNVVGVFWFSIQILSEIFLILRRIHRDTIKNVHLSSRKVSLFSGIKVTRIFLTYFRKNQISNFMKICPLEAELFHADRRTDMTKLIVAFRNIANAPKTFVKRRSWPNVRWDRKNVRLSLWYVTPCRLLNSDRCFEG